MYGQVNERARQKWFARLHLENFAVDAPANSDQGKVVVETNHHLIPREITDILYIYKSSVSNRMCAFGFVLKLCVRVCGFLMN